MQYFTYIFFCSKVFAIWCVFYTQSTSHFRLATSQVLRATVSLWGLYQRGQRYLKTRPVQQEVREKEGALGCSSQWFYPQQLLHQHLVIKSSAILSLAPLCRRGTHWNANTQQPQSLQTLRQTDLVVTPLQLREPTLATAALHRSPRPPLPPGQSGVLPVSIASSSESGLLSLNGGILAAREAGKMCLLFSFYGGSWAPLTQEGDFSCCPARKNDRSPLLEQPETLKF